jgi:hypothetical protein
LLTICWGIFEEKATRNRLDSCLGRTKFTLSHSPRSLQDISPGRSWSQLCHCCHTPSAYHPAKLTRRVESRCEVLQSLRPTAISWESDCTWSRVALRIDQKSAQHLEVDSASRTEIVTYGHDEYAEGPNGGVRRSSHLFLSM